ncbi:MAG: S9 family peptidase [Acidobacteria bacterium]|nr:S9 family peptidase [Acidobacteriota bacterium]
MSYATTLFMTASLLGLAAVPPPPKTRVEFANDTLHGVTIADPYRWLEDQKAPATRAWLAEQDKYMRSLIGPLPGRAALVKRLGELMRTERIDFPVERAGRYFYLKRAAGESQPSIMMRNGRAGAEEKLLDPASLAKDLTASPVILDVSADGKLLAYGVRQGGADELAVRFLNTGTRQTMAESLPTARYFGVQFNREASGFFYSRYSPQGSTVRFHAFGKPPASDEEIYGKGTTAKDIVLVTVDDAYTHLIVAVAHGVPAESSEIFVRPLSGGALRTVITGIQARFEEAVIANGRLYVLTSWNAENGRVLSIDLARPERSNWREVVKESTSAIESMNISGGRLFVSYLENAASRIRSFDLDGKPLAAVELPGIGSTEGPYGNVQGGEAFFRFVSFTDPGAIYRYDTRTGQREVWSRVSIPFDAGQVAVKQVWYASKDGTRIPMFLVHRKDLAPDGKRPVYLTGYGGFNLSRTPAFSPSAAYWVERGGVFALPNLRGGGEFGEKWHKAGMFGNKQNVFDDFLAAAQWLIDHKYTAPAKLAISGRSNGGLLVGAAMTQRPDLFGAVLCGVPLLDMVRYQNFLVGRYWTTEYGSSENAEQFKYIFKYSPYHHVEKGAKYPAVMFVTGDADTRVDPLHARKMTALMQASSASGKPVLLHYDTKAGHSGGKPIAAQVDDVADELQFLLWQLGEL